MNYSDQDGDLPTSDWMLNAIEMFKAGHYKEARTPAEAKDQEYDDTHKFMYLQLRTQTTDSTTRPSGYY